MSRVFEVHIKNWVLETQIKEWKFESNYWNFVHCLITKGTVLPFQQILLYIFKKYSSNGNIKK